MAWAAMAIASSPKARKVQIVNASWWVAIDTDWSSPEEASAPSTTAYVVSSSAAAQRQGADDEGDAGVGGAPDAGEVGPQAALSRRAPRTTTASRAAALASWASTEPRAEPAMPRPSTPVPPTESRRPAAG